VGVVCIVRFGFFPNRKGEEMATKKKSVKAEEPVAEEKGAKHAIPMMGERKGRPTSVINRHRARLKPSAAVKDSERPVIDIPAGTQTKFVEFARTKEIFDLVESQKKSQQKEVSSEIYERFVDVMWSGKCQPKNPNVEAVGPGGTVDATGQFIVSAGSKIKIDMPEVRDGEEPEEALVRGLVTAGVDPSNATRLVEEEVSFVPAWTLSFTDLMRGKMTEGRIVEPTETQRSAAEILFCVINGEDLDGNEIDDGGRLELLSGISHEGWAALGRDIQDRTSYFPVLADGKGFLDRASGYADSREELGAILTVFAPTYYCQRVVFAPNDTQSSKKARMVAEAKNIIGG
jgi:hypothetical protein